MMLVMSFRETLLKISASHRRSLSQVEFVSRVYVVVVVVVVVANIYSEML